MKFRNRIWMNLGGLFRLVRPLNCLMFFAGTYVGGVIVDRFQAFEWPENADLVLAAVSATFVGAGANAINDVFDVTADAVNRPNRPIPTQAVSVSAARLVWVLLSVLGIGLGFLVSGVHGPLAALVVVMLYAYSARLKSIPVVGNVVVGATVSVALVYGALAFGAVLPVLPAVVFAFTTNLAREVIKDVQDVRGDAAQRVGSLPLRHGETSGVILFSTLVVATIMMTPVPFVLLGYGGLYLLLILFADGALLAALWSGVDREREGFAGRASALVKVAMFFGLGALSLAGVVG